MIVEDVLKVERDYNKEIEKMRSMKVPIILFGAGSTNKFNLDYFRKKGINIIAFCDNSQEKVGNYVDNIPILSFQELVSIYPMAYVYITTQMHFGAIRKQLLDAGFESNQISEYDLIFQMQWEEKCMEYYKKKAVQIEYLYHILGDKASKEVLKNRLLFLHTRKRIYAESMHDNNQYFDERIIDFDRVHSFVDLGMYIGDTIEEFIKRKKNYRLIYGFEPDKEIFVEAKENLKECSNIVFVNKATSDYNGEIRIGQSLGVMQTIEKGIFEENGNDAVFEVCKLDDFFKEANEKEIDMIKMDIEGAEYATLNGAVDLIKNHKPILAICIYHRQEDLIEIPQFCLSLFREEVYDLYLRHYSDTQSETVMYFVPRSFEI